MLLKLLLLLTGLFSLIISVVVALAYDDPYFAGISRFLAPPDGCPAPCFMGIRPGQTTLREAVAILERHEWVDEVRVYLDDLVQDEGLVCWSWSGKQPAFVEVNTYVSPCLHTRRGSRIIRGISIPASISFGEVWLLYQPEQIMLTDFTKVKASAYYTGVYLQNTLFVTANSLSCPINVSRIWDMPTTLEIGEMSESYFRGRATYAFPAYDLTLWLKNRPC